MCQVYYQHANATKNLPACTNCIQKLLSTSQKIKQFNLPYVYLSL